MNFNVITFLLNYYYHFILSLKFDKIQMLFSKYTVKPLILRHGLTKIKFDLSH